jgi:two-component system chemotaxis response regulator CheB
MNEIKKILVAEDELTNSILLKRILTKAGYSVVVANNGLDALKHLEKETFDALVTDWMMPQMDGIELIRKTREKVKPLPLMVMVTALVSEGAKNYALESGADDYIAKPIDVEELLSRLKDGFERKHQTAPSTPSAFVTKSINVIPPFIGVVIATSTGGPPTLLEVFKNIPENTNAAFFIVQHGPSWMLETFSQRLQKETNFNVHLASHNQETVVGNIYVAPGDKHMRINPSTYRLELDDGPKENFVRPAADPLFRSASEAFGKFCIGVVLTGLGRDGAQGAIQISSNSGTLLIQDPETAVAPSMPRTAVETGVQHRLIPLSEMGKAISEAVFPISASLKKLIANR